MNLKRDLKQKLESLKDEFGEVEDIILIRTAYHGCSPSLEHGWKCEAVKLEGDDAILGEVWWDFQLWVDDHGDTDDAADYPWDIATSDDFEEGEAFDLRDKSDVNELMSRL